MRAINLFCGGGGFAQGAVRAGVSVEAAIDVDVVLTSSYTANFPGTALHLADIAMLSGSEVLDLVGGDVDLVFGGPPCQAFSNIGLRDVNDPRRLLLRDFFRLVSEIRPAIFVMENVVGLTQGHARKLLDDAIELVSARYQVLGPVKLDACDFGGATKRRRVFVMGHDRDRCDEITIEDIQAFRGPSATVAEAISDLEHAEYCTQDPDGFDKWRLPVSDGISAYARSLRSDDSTFSGHRLTAHRPDVIERFRAVEPGEMDLVGRHPRLTWDGQCPTLRAGTGPERGSYQSLRPIHPTHPRVITVREAARLQGFPDRHLFHPTIWHSFRMIGNSVSPFVAQAIFRAIMLRTGTSRKVEMVDSDVAERLRWTA